jgi:hypothetical protein
MTTNNFCTFEVFDESSNNNRIATGIVIKKNKKTVLVQPVRFKRYPFSTSHQVFTSGAAIYRRIAKNKVRIYPLGIIPIN